MHIEPLHFVEETGQVLTIAASDHSPDLVVLAVAVVDEQAMDEEREKRAEQAAARIERAVEAGDEEEVAKAREAAAQPVEPQMATTSYHIDVADWVDFLTHVVRAHASSVASEWTWTWRTASGMDASGSLGEDGLVLTSSRQCLIGPDAVEALIAYARPVIAAEAAKARIIVAPDSRASSMSALLGGRRRIR